MGKEQCWIDTDPSKTRAFRSFCGPESIRRLKPDMPLDPPLVDTIVALAMPAGSELPSAYLGTEIYEETKKSGFGQSKDLVSHMPRDKPWMFGIRVSDHWSAVEINWEAGKIGFYDPQYYRARTTAWDRVTDVSKDLQGFSASNAHVLLQHIKSWIEHLCDEDTCRTWDLCERFGPLQNRGDTLHCGVFTALTLCVWLHGREVEEQVADPIKCRLSFAAQIWKSVREGKVCPE